VKPIPHLLQYFSNTLQSVGSGALAQTHRLVIYRGLGSRPSGPMVCHRRLDRLAHLMVPTVTALLDAGDSGLHESTPRLRVRKNTSLQYSLSGRAETVSMVQHVL